MTVSGNVDLRDGRGFGNGPDSCNPVAPGCVCPPGSQLTCPPVGYRGEILLSGNEAIGNGTGFFVEPETVLFFPPTAPFVLQDNVVRGAGTGFSVDPGYVQCDDCTLMPTVGGAGGEEPLRRKRPG